MEQRRYTAHGCLQIRLSHTHCLFLSIPLPVIKHTLSRRPYPNSHGKLTDMGVGSSKEEAHLKWISPELLALHV